MQTIVKMLFGSVVYGTNTPESDTDYKAIAVPSARDIVLQRAFSAIMKSTGSDTSKNGKDDVDEAIISLHHFMRQLLSGQTYALDMMFTPKEFYVQSSPMWALILENRHKFLHNGVASFAGYCQTQAAKYSLKGSNVAAFRLVRDFFLEYPKKTKVLEVMEDFETKVFKVADNDKVYHEKQDSIIQLVSILNKKTNQQEFFIQVGPKTKVPLNATCGLAAEIFSDQFNKYGERAKLAETNQGVDFKALSHAVRVCREAEELLLTGNITFPLADPVVKQIKMKELPFAQVSELIVEGLDRVHAAKAKSSLPDKPDYKAAEDLVAEIYAECVIKGHILC